MPTLREWFVVSPEYGNYWDHGRDVVRVTARTQREAIVKGVRAMRKDRGCDYHRSLLDFENPFRGMNAHLAEPELTKEREANHATPA